MTTMNEWLPNVLGHYYLTREGKNAVWAKEDCVFLSLPNKIRIVLYANMSSLHDYERSY